MRIVPVAAIADSFRNPTEPGCSTWRAVVRRAWMSLSALSAAVMLTGCATTKAATVIESPALAVPQAPERVLVPAEKDPLVATAVGPDTPLSSVPRVQQPVASTPRPRSAVRTESETRSDAAQPVSSAAAQGPAAPDASRQLRVVPSSAEMAADHALVQNLITKVEADLKKVDPSKLSTNDAANFKDSKRFSEQAQEKLREGNVNFARVAAEKAAELVATLANR